MFLKSLEFLGYSSSLDFQSFEISSIQTIKWIWKSIRFLENFWVCTLCLSPPARPLKGAFGRRLLRRIREANSLAPLQYQQQLQREFEFSTATLASLSLTAVQSNTKTQWLQKRGYQNGPDTFEFSGDLKHTSNYEQR